MPVTGKRVVGGRDAVKQKKLTPFEIASISFFRADPQAVVYASPSTGRVHIEFGDGSRARFERPRGAETENLARQIRHGTLPQVEESCWHCGVVLLPDALPPRCEGCPDEQCDDANCPQECCQGSSESVNAQDVVGMTEFAVPKPEVIVNAVIAAAPHAGRFYSFSKVAGSYHERIRAWRVEQRAAGKSQDYVDAKSNDFVYLLNEALENAGKLLDQEQVATPLGPVRV